jgi:guanyl-specific ribonuclease Sa
VSNRNPRAWKPWLVVAIVLLLGWSLWPRDPAPRPSAGPRDASPSVVRDTPAPRPADAPATTFPAAGPDLPAFLPPEAHDTIRLIRRGGPYPHRQDGGVFGNREGHLPRQSRGWYREYTVETPGARNRGARRIITGGNPPSEWYYTDDHYDSFRRFDLEGAPP